MKLCPTCGEAHPEEFRVCPDCGGNLVELSHKHGVTPDLTMGSENVIAGDVGSVTYDIRGDAVIHASFDPTREVRTCAICGAVRTVVEGHNCPRCKRFVCNRDFVRELAQCRECSGFYDLRDDPAMDLDRPPSPEVTHAIVHVSEASAVYQSHFQTARTDLPLDPDSLEIQLIVSPQRVASLSRASISRSLRTLYLYLEALLRIGATADVQASLKELSAAGGQYEDFALLRHAELVAEQGHPELVATKELPWKPTLRRYAEWVEDFVLWLSTPEAPAADLVWLADRKGNASWAWRKLRTIGGDLGPTRRRFATLHDERAGKVHWITGDTPIGRSGSGIVVDSPFVSRTHAELRVNADGTVVVRDCGSKNGSCLNGRPLVRGRYTLVRTGDMLTLADYTLTFHEVSRE